MGRGDRTVKDSFSSVLGEKRGSAHNEPSKEPQSSIITIQGDWSKIEAGSGVLLRFPGPFGRQNEEQHAVFEKLGDLEEEASTSMPTTTAIFIHAPSWADWSPERLQEIADQIGAGLRMKPGSIRPLVPIQREGTSFMHLKAYS